MARPRRSSHCPAEDALLRATLLVIGGVMLAAATFGALACWRLSAVIPLAVWGAILAGGVLVERWRYRPLADSRPGGNWRATQERFVDPESGRRDDRRFLQKATRAIVSLSVTSEWPAVSADPV